jgi:hypothetical protein
VWNGPSHRSRDLPSRNPIVHPECSSQPPSSDVATRSIRQRKRVSQRRIEANRRNAQLSTGPQTARGKKTISRNALKHGLLAREVVITGGDGEESQREFDALVARLQNQYRPSGAIEEMLVERIATCWWRLARVHRAETGEIRRELDCARLNSYVSASNKASVDLFMVNLLNPEARTHSSVPLFDSNSRLQERLEMLAKTQSELKKDFVGATFQLSVLKQVKRELTEFGRLSDETKELLFDTLAFCDSRLILLCNSLTAEGNKTEGRPKPNGDRGDSKKYPAICLLNREIERLELFCQYAPVRAEYERAADVQIRSLPSAEKADKLLRYETHLERQLYRAMEELERLQR